MWEKMEAIAKCLESTLGPVVDESWGFGGRNDYGIRIAFYPDAFWRESAGREGEGDGGEKKNMVGGVGCE